MIAHGGLYNGRDGAPERARTARWAAECEEERVESKMRIAVCDDEQAIADLVGQLLVEAGFAPTVFYAAPDLLACQADDPFDLVILDIMMPGMDGFACCRELRRTSSVPIIFLTAKDEEVDKVVGFELGADDYVVKPFETKEVIARINAVLRRIGKKETAQTQEVSYENLTINLTNYELKVKGVQVDTPPKEMELIYHLASNPNRVFTRDQLLDEVWGFDYYGDSRTVDVHVKRLREKLEGVSDKWALKTVWGVGYKFEVK